MIVPHKIDLQGVIGGTFQWSFTLYQTQITDNYRGIWRSDIFYTKNDCVLGSDNTPYRLTSSGEDIDPTDLDGPWQRFVTMNLTGWTGELTIGNQGSPQVTSAATVGGSDGAVSVSATSTQTSTLLLGKQHIFVSLADTGGRVFYPVSGTVNFVSP